MQRRGRREKNSKSIRVLWESNYKLEIYINEESGHYDLKKSVLVYGPLSNDCCGWLKRGKWELDFHDYVISLRRGIQDRIDKENKRIQDILDAY